MKRFDILVAVIIFTLISGISQARIVIGWAPERLYDECDAAVIGKVLEIRENVTTTTLSHYYPVQIRQAKIEVSWRIKGKAPSIIILEYPANVTLTSGTISNGHFFIQLKTGEYYLMYLTKKGVEGVYQSVRYGDYDEIDSAKSVNINNSGGSSWFRNYPESEIVENYWQTGKVNPLPRIVNKRMNQNINKYWDLPVQQLEPEKITKREDRPSLNNVEDDPALPRVLLIGDSISNGYLLPVRALLEGKANVHRGFSGTTYRGIEKLDLRLGDKPWDLIHFNFGLHDLVLTKDVGYAVPLEEYEQNLKILIKRLKATKAKLIWASSTPVTSEPSKTAPRNNKSVINYNAAAAKIMKAEGIPINELYALRPAINDLRLPNDNTHFSKQGYQILADKVAKTIEAALNQTNSD